ncbi:hypothetical protein BD324DRAFT_649139 [Kockovaella imperatae]|uniref:Extracellular membrane protein CFEM domain-containing protein n=1 Tax=Kockovaella imperatae TaxID=4999 RepID=A0A1Y1UNK7_9TREE|nr:hypothetical protein BD324DRAFT_649139 [Kockovaella imperatae]ORX39046.1 hypothetical protein BD324DRAFT_649139 [Kockovaella imperatae]
MELYSSLSLACLWGIAVASGRLTRRGDSFSLADTANACSQECDNQNLAGCSSSDPTEEFKCICQVAILQEYAECIECIYQTGGTLEINGTATSANQYLDAFLADCDAEGYDIVSTVFDAYTTGIYTTSPASATSTPATTAFSTTAAASAKAGNQAPSRGASPSNPVFFPPTPYNTTASSSAYDSSEGLCIVNFFTGWTPGYLNCLYDAMVLIPESSSSCQDQVCTWTESDPKLCSGLMCNQGSTIPSPMICDAIFHDASNGNSIPQVQQAGEDLDSVQLWYICNCNGPTPSVPEECAGPCGQNCQTSLSKVTSDLRCNYAAICIDGSSDNPREDDTSTCVSPLFAQTNASGVEYILYNGGVIPCSATSGPFGLDSCGTSGSSFNSGSASCSCTGKALNSDPCGLVDATNTTTQQQQGQNGPSTSATAVTAASNTTSPSPSSSSGSPAASVFGYKQVLLGLAVGAVFHML